MLIENPTLRYRRMHPGSFNIWMPLLLMNGSLIVFWFLAEVPNDWMLPALTAVCAAVTVYYVFHMLTVITIGPDGIRYKSLLKDVRMRWDEIGTIGVYVQGRKVFKILEEREYNYKQFGGQRWLFFAREKNFQPHQVITPGENFVDLQYRKEAWEVVKRYAKF